MRNKDQKNRKKGLVALCILVIFAVIAVYFYDRDSITDHMPTEAAHPPEIQQTK